MKVYFANGLHVHVDGLHLLFDPTTYFENYFLSSDLSVVGHNNPVDIIFLSHAHADHCNALKDYLEVNPNIPCVIHKITREIILMTQPVDNPIYIKEGEKKDIRGITVEAFNAGHCMGALQYRLETSEGKFLFTGDINTENTLTMSSAPIVESDFIAIESTLGGKDNILPPRDELYMSIFTKLTEFHGKNNIAVFYAYPLGKSQELISLFNMVDARDFDIMVDWKTFQHNMIYERYVNSLGEYKKWDGKELNGSKNAMIINLSRIKGGKGIGDRLGMVSEPPSLIVSAIGEMLDLFPFIDLSSHADYPHLVQYVEESVKKSSNPVIFPFHDTNHFNKSLKKKGFNDVYDPHSEIYGLNS